MNIHQMIQAHVAIAKLERNSGRPRQFGTSARVIDKLEVVDDASRQVRIDDVIRTEWGIKLAHAISGVETVSADILEPDYKKDGFARPKLIKKRHSRKGAIEVKKELIRVDGKMVEVQVKVLHPGNEYYVGKSVPSGKAPWGTKDTEDQSAARAERKFIGYVEKRLESAAEAETSGKLRKGGSSEDYLEVLASLQHEAGNNLDLV